MTGSDKNCAQEPPFGTYAPNRFQSAILGITRRLPRNAFGRRINGLLRRLVLAFLKTPLDVQTFGANVRFHPHDNLCEKRVLFTPHMFDPAEMAVLRAALQGNFTFIDIGANAGLYALAMAAQGGPGARILAIEPQPEMARRLRFNIQASGFTNITHIADALSDAPGTAVLRIVHKNRGASGFAPRKYGAGDACITVKTRTLLGLMNDQNITRADAMKIDIEGAEDQVLPLFFETCPKDRLPRLIIMERNEDWKIDCLALAKSIGYQEVGKGRMNAILRLDEETE